MGEVFDFVNRYEGVWDQQHGSKYWIVMLDRNTRLDFEILNSIGSTPLQVLSRIKQKGYDAREAALAMHVNKEIRLHKGLKETIFDLWKDNFDRIKMLKKYGDK